MRIRKRIDHPNQDISEDDKEEEPSQRGRAFRWALPVKPKIRSSSPETTTPTAAEYRSVCTVSAANNLASQFNVPCEYGLRAPTAEQRAHAPPPGYAAIYTHHFRSGLGLPLPPFLVAVLAHYRIALAQLHPNGVLDILGFVKRCEGLSAVPTISLFRQFFHLQRTGVGMGWYRFRPVGRKIVQGPTSRVIRWKKSFLFFKTEPLAGKLSLVWNPSPDIEPPLAEDEGPLAQAVRMLKASAEEDISMSSLPEKGITKVQTNWSSTEDEATSIPSAKSKNATKNPNTVSTELPNSECRQKKLKRMAEVYATKPAKALRGLTRKKFVDESSEIPSVQESEDMTTTEFQTSVCSLNLQLQGEKEKLERVVESTKQDLKDKEREISLLQEGKKEMEKENASLKAEVFQLREREKEIALLQGEKKELEKRNASLKAEVFRLRDRENETGSLQRDKVELQKENYLHKTKVSQLQDRKNETASLQGYKEELQTEYDMLESKVSWFRDREYEIASLQGDEVELQEKNEIASLQGDKEELQIGVLIERVDREQRLARLDSLVI